jgi:DNA modification methylase
MTNTYFHTIGDASLYTGDSLSILEALPSQSVNTCITSPPYFGLRDYGMDGQMGLEGTPEAYTAAMVAVFEEVRRVLRDDGTLWLNLGDSYCATSTGLSDQLSSTLGGGKSTQIEAGKRPDKSKIAGLKQKDLCGIPWRVALALQSAGWYLRQDIIWHKPNPMPESVKDRCTKAHEYIFLLSKSARYYFDHEAIKEPLASSSVARLSQPTLDQQKGSDRVPGKTNGSMKAVGKLKSGNKERKQRPGADALSIGAQAGSIPWEDSDGKRNKRSVWAVTTKPYKGAHFATFPPDLITPCVLAGAPDGGTVLDPFSGSGTTGQVALAHGRKYIGLELNPEYQKLAIKRIKG